MSVKMDPALFKYMGKVEMGFYQEKISGQMKVVVKPTPADDNDRTALAITALYTAAVQEALQTVSKAVQQAGLIERLSNIGPVGEDG